MRVKVLKSFRPYYNYGLVDLTAGDEVGGGLALYLLQTGSSVEPVDDDARAVAAELVAPDEPDGDEPPEELDIDAVAAVVLAWVGEDPDRARVALDAEQAKGEAARSTLVKALEKIASS